MSKKVNDITGEIINASIKVHKTMGPGLYEKVYEECLAHELTKRKLSYKKQHPVTIQYEDLIIPQAFKIDLLVEDFIIVELKSVDQILPIHEAQILTYMKLTNIQTGLLLNFNSKLLKDGIHRFKL